MTVDLQHLLHTTPLNTHSHIDLARLQTAHAYVHTHTHTCIHTYIHTYIHIHTYTHTYIHTYTHTYIHTYIHTNIHTQEHLITSTAVKRRCFISNVL